MPSKTRPALTKTIAVISKTRTVPEECGPVGGGGGGGGLRASSASRPSQ